MHDSSLKTSLGTRRKLTPRWVFLASVKAIGRHPPVIFHTGRRSA